jgi:recombination protein RecA
MSNLAKAIDDLNKIYGKGSVNKIKDMDYPEIEWLSSGSLALDLALGGGYAKGRIVEIYGPESSGKTTLTLHAIAECQKAGGTAAYIDAEHSFDANYAKNIGVNVDELVWSQPDNAEEGMEVAKKLVDSGEIQLLVIDSIAALSPKKEIEGEAGDAVVGLQARLMSQFMRKIKGTVSRNDCVMICINQLRDKIGIMFGSPETTTGGNALKFYASQRLDIRKTKTNSEDGASISNDVKITVKKNKVAPPFKIATTVIEFGKGIVVEAELLDMCAERDIIKKAGSWYSYEEARLGQGRPAAVECLQENPEVVEELIAKLKASY